MAKLEEVDKLPEGTVPLGAATPAQSLEEVAGPPPTLTSGQVAKNMGAAAAKGVSSAARRLGVDALTGAPQVVAGMADLLSLPLPEDRRTIGGKTPSELVREFRDKVGGPKLGMASDIANAAGAGAALSRVFGGGAVRGAVAGGLSEPGAKLGGIMSEGLGGPAWPGEIAGATIAGSPTLLSRGMPTTNQLLAEVIKGRSQGEIQQAIALQRLGNQHGVRLQLPQLFEQPGAEFRLLQDVLDSRAGKGALESNVFSVKPSADALAKSVQNAYGAADRSVEGAAKVERAIEGALAEPKKVAGKIAQPIYDMLAQQRPKLPVNERFQIAHELEKLTEDVGLLEKSAAGRAGRQIERTVVVKSPILQQSGAPFKLAEGDIYSLDNYLKELSTRIRKLSSATATSDEAAKLAGVRSGYETIRNRLLAASPDLKDAKDLYKGARQSLEKQLDVTMLRKAAPEFGATGERNTPQWKRLHAVLEGDPHNVKVAATEMRMQDPASFRETVKNYLAGRFEDAFRVNRPDAAAKFAKGLADNPNLDMILREAAVGQVPDPDAFAKGFKNALRVLEASGRPVPLPSGRGDLATILAESPEAIAGRVGLGNQLARNAAILQAVRNVAYRRQYEALSKVFADPESMKRVAELANAPVVSKRATGLLSGILGGTVTLEE